MDVNHVFQAVESDQLLASELKSLSHKFIEEATDEAFSKLFDLQKSADDKIPNLSLGAAAIICVLQQWLIRYLCKTLMQLLTPEALIYHRKKIPSSYVESYLNHQHHFSLLDLIKQHCKLQNQYDR